MEFGGWRCVRFTCVFLSLLFQARAFTHITTNLCKWCDQSSPVCEDNICMSNCNFSSFCTHAEEVCLAVWKKENESVSVQTLCHNPQHALENMVLPNTSSTECVMTSVPSENSMLFLCSCIREHDCNDRLVFEKGANGFSRLRSKDVIPVVVISLVPPLLVAVIATMAFYLYRTRHLTKQPKDWAPKRTHYQSLDPPEACAGQVNASDYHGKLLSLGGDASSDISSSCANSLNHNTEHLPIQLEALVGKGRFAEVWRVRLNHSECAQYETVAVKIFPAVEYVSWRNERDIFSDPNLKHENIVQFLTAEQRGGTAGAPQRQYWLIMAYHALGNLQDFLMNHVLTWSQLCAMSSSVARGLAHLHNDTTPCGTPKTPIAHRDLKSSNIVMKSANECALCDFGLALSRSDHAVQHGPQLRTQPAAGEPPQGTTAQRPGRAAVRLRVFPHRERLRGFRTLEAAPPSHLQERRGHEGASGSVPGPHQRPVPPAGGNSSRLLCGHRVPEQLPHLHFTGFVPVRRVSGGQRFSTQESPEVQRSPDQNVPLGFRRRPGRVRTGGGGASRRGHAGVRSSRGGRTRRLTFVVILIILIPMILCVCNFNTL